MVIVLSNLDGCESDASWKTAQQASIELGGSKIVRLAEHDWHQVLEGASVDSVFFLATHGGYGENGELQAFLERRGIRHTHSRSDTARILSNKHLTKMLYLRLGINTPGWKYQGKSWGRPFSEGGFVQKPISGGSKIGVCYTKKLQDDGTLLHEEFVDGSLEISVSILGSSDIVVLPCCVRQRSIMQIGKLDHCDWVPTPRIRDACLDMAREIHVSSGARGVTKTDFVISSALEVLAIETDCHPGLSMDNSTIRQAAMAGVSSRDVFQRIVSDVD